jgi:hypothetical protein
MAADPSSAQWETALTLATSLGEHSVKTTLACVRPPSVEAHAVATKIAGLEVIIRGDGSSLEWMLFLEMLVKPDLIQLFDPEHVLMPWRSPTVLQVQDGELLRPTVALLEAAVTANLVIVEDEARFDKLQAIVGVGPFVAVLPTGQNCGWNYFLAYEEIVQAARLDLAEESAGRFELI